MNHRTIGLVGAALLVLAAACAGEVPASLLLTVDNQEGAPAPDQVRVRAYDGDGQAHGFVSFAVPAPGPGGRLGTVVVYPRGNRTGALRIEAQGLKADAVVSTGQVQVSLQVGRQNSAAVRLAGPASTADRDGDGVPDEIDDCPGLANRGQEDSRGDGVGDACRGGTDVDGPDGQAGDGQADDGRDAAAPDLAGTDKALGAACSSGTQCTSGFCVDDVCCEGACTDACRSCALPGRAGQCAPVPAGMPDPHGACTTESATSCGFDGRCNGAGGCRRHPAGTECRPPSCAGSTDRVMPGTCDGNGLCATGRTQSCAPYLCANAACKVTCGGSSDCAPGNTCSSGSCGKKPLGTSCATSGDCASGFCADEVCCESACTTPCRRCDGAQGGLCQVITNSRDYNASPSCSGSRRCDDGGVCR